MRAMMTLALVLGCSGTLQAEERRLYQTAFQRPADQPALGSQYRAAVADAARQIRQGEFAAGTRALAPALAYCDAQRARPNLRFVAVSSPAQYQRFLDGNPDTTPLEWLDMACADAYHNAGYALVAQRRFEAALAYLDSAIALAPYFPDALTERGAALNQLGRHDEALASYRRAIALGQAEPRAAYAQALAWRGAGYALVELRQWPQARAAYQHSLELEPGNPLATDELAFIERNAPDTH